MCKLVYRKIHRVNPVIYKELEGHLDSADLLQGQNFVNKREKRKTNICSFGSAPKYNGSSFVHSCP